MKPKSQRTNHSSATGAERLPANFDAERAILGGILLNSAAYNEASEQLKPEEFLLDSNRRLFRCMVELADSSRPIDHITLVEELDRRGELEAIGGRAYIGSLLDGVPDQPSIAHYVKMVRDKAVLRSVMHMSEAAKLRAAEQIDTPDEILSDIQAQLSELSEKRIGKSWMGVQEIVKTSFGSIDGLLKRGRRITGVETYYPDIDDLTSGFQKSDLIIIAGRPSMGKTAFAMNIAENAAIKGGKTIGVFSLEMSKGALLQRMLCSIGNVSSHRLRTGSLWLDDTHKIVKALGILGDAKIFIDDTGNLTVSEMRARARLLHSSQGGLDMLIVDYLQLMSGGSTRIENRTQEVTAISRGLKALAKELSVPVVALSQLSRAPESRRANKHRPQLADLRESGSIEQDADVVAFVFREEIYKPDDADLRGRAEIIIRKQRNGPTGTVKMSFLNEYTRFESYADELSAAAAD